MESTRNSAKVRMSEARVSQSMNLMNFCQNQDLLPLRAARVEDSAFNQPFSKAPHQCSTDDARASISEADFLGRAKKFTFSIPKQKSIRLITATKQWLGSVGF